MALSITTGKSVPVCSAVKTYDIPDNEPTEYYSSDFFTDLDNERLYRLAQILEHESGEYCSMFGFEEAVFYTQSKVWHFFNTQGLFIITEKQLNSIGVWVDAQNELESDLIEQSDWIVNNYSERYVA